MGYNPTMHLIDQGSLPDGLRFAQSLLRQKLQLGISYRGKKTLAIEFIVQDFHDGNHGRGDQHAQHAKNLHA